ncbi:MAG: DoxX family protein [Myxococcales bacterium]|nr:DoxX family protein [Myxococcales bacterium]
MVDELIRTERRVELALSRLVVAVVLWPHGAQKVLGWFGGYGFSGTQGYFVETLGMPWLLGALVIAIEFTGPVLLVVGLAVRPVAVLVAAVMLGAVTVGGHYEHGFFMNWFGTQSGEGFEYHLLMVALCAVLVVGGAGAWSVDARLRQISSP